MELIIVKPRFHLPFHFAWNEVIAIVVVIVIVVVVVVVVSMIDYVY